MLVLDRLCFGLYHLSVVGYISVVFWFTLVVPRCFSGSRVFQLFFSDTLIVYGYFNCCFRIRQLFPGISTVFLRYINCSRAFQLLFSNMSIVLGHFPMFFSDILVVLGYFGCPRIYFSCFRLYKLFSGISVVVLGYSCCLCLETLFLRVALSHILLSQLLSSPWK